jgi:hypothetical protein
MNPLPLRFPVAHEYSAAVQNPDKMFRTQELRNARFAMDGPGRPKVYSGNFASTFVADLSDKRRVAVRVFLKADPLNRDERYRKISAFLAARRPSSFARFEYMPNEVLASGHRWPVIMMEWVEGQTLDVFMSHAAMKGRRDLLSSLRNHIVELSRAVESGGFSHGDLNTGNVLVTPELRHGVKLVDYDGMYVPDMAIGAAGAPGEEGTPGTRHPHRKRSHFGPQMDRFSCIVIDVCAAALIEAPDCWTSLNSDPSRLLFDELDFQQPASSRAFKQLESRGSPELRRLLAHLARIAADPPEKCPTLEEFRKLAGGAPLALATPATTSPLAATAAPVRILERIAVDGRDFGAVRTHCDSEIDVLAPIFEEPQERTDRNGDRYLFVNFGNWRFGNCVKVIVWGGKGVDEFFDHANLVGKVARGRFTGRWVCVTGTPQYYERHESIDIALNSVGQIRFVAETDAIDMLERARRGQYRGAPASAAAHDATAAIRLTASADAASDVQRHNARVLAALGPRGGLSASPPPQLVAVLAPQLASTMSSAPSGGSSLTPALPVPSISPSSSPMPPVSASTPPFSAKAAAGIGAWIVFMVVIALILASLTSSCTS